MLEHVTLLRPEAPTPEDRGLSASLPHDLLEQVRGRLRMLALLVIIGFAIDPVLFFGALLVSRLTGSGIAPEYVRQIVFYLADVGVVLGSALLWWVARSPRVSSARLLSIGLVYEVVICFVVALRTYWEYHRVMGVLPNLTWVPAVVILFPLILPAPPRVMLAVSVAAGAMQPLALFLLDAWGKVPVSGSDILNASINSVIAVGFAYMGARVVYGLGREVAAARELGSYRLQEQLGQGGMGEVWRAEHRMLARPAAIKLIRPSRLDGAPAAASSDAVRRFEREAKAIARLRSPHTVELFDFGIADDGSFYYVMELLDGLDVHALVKRHGPVPPERAVHLLRQVCHSLSEAESCSLVHRDIKPANIFLCRYGEDYDFVKVLDFGIVKGAHDEPEAGALTRENAIQGTPAFIGPRAGAGHGPGGRPGRHLRCRLCRLLAADRQARLQRRHRARARHAARHRRARAAVHAQRRPDPAGARRAGAGLPREGPRCAAADGARAFAAPRRGRRSGGMGRRARASVVGGARTWSGTA